MVSQFEFVLGGRKPAKINHAANLHRSMLEAATKYTPSMKGLLMEQSCFTGPIGKRKHATDSPALTDPCFDVSDDSEEETTATRQPQNLEGNESQRSTETRTNYDAACPNAPAFDYDEDEKGISRSDYELFARLQEEAKKRTAMIATLDKKTAISEKNLRAKTIRYAEQAKLKKDTIANLETIVDTMQQNNSNQDTTALSPRYGHATRACGSRTPFTDFIRSGVLPANDFDHINLLETQSSVPLHTPTQADGEAKQGKHAGNKRAGSSISAATTNKSPPKTRRRPAASTSSKLIADATVGVDSLPPLQIVRDPAQIEMKSNNGALLFTIKHVPNNVDTIMFGVPCSDSQNGLAKYRFDAVFLCENISALNSARLHLNTSPQPDLPLLNRHDGGSAVYWSGTGTPILFAHADFLWTDDDCDGYGSIHNTTEDGTSSDETSDEPSLPPKTENKPLPKSSEGQ